MFFGDTGDSAPKARLYHTIRTAESHSTATRFTTQRAKLYSWRWTRRQARKFGQVPWLTTKPAITFPWPRLSPAVRSWLELPGANKEVKRGPRATSGRPEARQFG